ncbi:MAG: phycocyanin alpha phycocyanobilin lyase related protein NblB-like protein [Actinomycetia bacterium]|nr:phycocyanin alpha phycocyanobilin lyase related protein NblB-like protein [Actinomycetes bacterium]
MTYNVSISIALAVLAGILALLTIATAMRRAFVNAHDRRQGRLEAALRPRLLRLLATEDPDLDALAPQGKHAGRVLDALAAGLLPKLRGSDRAGVVELLERRGAVDRACRATMSRRAVLRARAAEQLGNIGLHRTQPDVARLLHDRHPEVRAAAARALGKQGDVESAPSLLRALDNGLVPANVVSMALMRLGDRSAPLLEMTLRESSVPSRVVCCELLGLFGAVGAVPAIAAIATTDPGYWSRLAAIRALGRIGSPKCLAPLLTCLHADRHAHRAEAARALGRLGATDAIAELVAALDDEHDVAFAAAAALTALGPEGMRTLETIGATPLRAGRYATEALIVHALEHERHAPSQFAAA